MITRLYNTEEDPAYCSVIWGANLTSSNDLVLDTTTATNATHIFANDLRDDLYVVSEICSQLSEGQSYN